MVKGFSSRAVENSLSDCMFRGTHWKLFCGSLGKGCLAQSSGNGWICHCLALVVWVTLTSEPFQICFPAQELARCWKMFLLFCFSWRKQLLTWEIMSGQFFCIYSYNFILLLLFFWRYCDFTTDYNKMRKTNTKWQQWCSNEGSCCCVNQNGWCCTQGIMIGSVNCWE